ncbi:MAG: EamA family transporter [Geodermatophilaceae bacterium]|nr:EamA family transporter [Geodermatophilaceae bacterium]MDQ3466299.1 EamA family transporter [Actinomycetota bacterium]
MIDCADAPRRLIRIDVSEAAQPSASRSGSRQARGVVLCVVSALSFAVLPFVANAAYDAGVGLTELLLLRFVIAATVLWLLVLRRPRPKPRRRVAAAGFAMGSIGYATQSALYFAALNYIQPSLDTLLLYTFPVIVFTVSVLRGRERASALRLGALTLALAGVAAVLLGSDAGSLDPLGVALGLGSAVAYATYILVGDALDPALDRLTLTALVCTGASVTYAIVALTSGGPDFGFDSAGWLWAAVLALVSTVVAVGTFFAGMRLIGASTASIVSCVEPVAAVLIGVGLYGDVLGPVQLLGAAAVVTAVVLLQVRVRRSRS